MVSKKKFGKKIKLIYSVTLLSHVGAFFWGEKMTSEIKPWKSSIRQWKAALVLAIDCPWGMRNEDQGNLNVDYVLDDSKKLLLILLAALMALDLCERMSFYFPRYIIKYLSAK